MLIYCVNYLLICALSFLSNYSNAQQTQNIGSAQPTQNLGSTQQTQNLGSAPPTQSLLPSAQQSENIGSAQQSQNLGSTQQSRSLASTLPTQTPSISISSSISIASSSSSSISSSSSVHYPQPPIPSITASRSPSAWTLDKDFDTSAAPTTREFYWNITAVAASPDGYLRQIYAINQQFPGPLIEVNQGDNVVVHVNNLLDIYQTIHWHGIDQNGSNWSDGVPGISHCPISPGQSFTYEFTVSEQYGTYWYHSHWANTMADGLIGAIVVHSNHDLLQKGVDFDDEIVLLIQDWMDVQSSDLITALASPEGWNGTPAPPQGDAILINGLGQTNCSNEDIQVQTTCLLPTPPEIQVVKGRKTRLRVINSGTYGLLRLSIDQHAFTVIEADDTPVHGPSGVHEICITVGQRYSIVIDADQGKAGDGFWIRVNSAPECLVGGGHVQTGLAVLRYVDEDGSSPSKAQPDTYAWNDLAGADGPCEDFDMQVSLVPRSGENAPTEVLQRHILSSQLGAFVDVNGKTFFGYGINNVSFESQMSNPLLLQLIQGKTLDDRYQASAIFDSIGGGDIVINNLDATSSHPFHLHGRSFWIVARGRGALGPDDGGVGVNTTAPLRRDTIEIPGDSYAILRIISDVSGVWPLHCHIGYHLAIGKMSAIVVNPPAIQEFTQPDKWKKLCSLYKGPAVVHGN